MDGYVHQRNRRSVEHVRKQLEWDYEHDERFEGLVDNDYAHQRNCRTVKLARKQLESDDEHDESLDRPEDVKKPKKGKYYSYTSSGKWNPSTSKAKSFSSSTRQKEDNSTPVARVQPTVIQSTTSIMSRTKAAKNSILGDTNDGFDRWKGPSTSMALPSLGQGKMKNKYGVLRNTFAANFDGSCAYRNAFDYTPPNFPEYHKKIEAQDPEEDGTELDFQVAVHSQDETDSRDSSKCDRVSDSYVKERLVAFEERLLQMEFDSDSNPIPADKSLRLNSYSSAEKAHRGHGDDTNKEYSLQLTETDTSPNLVWKPISKPFYPIEKQKSHPSVKKSLSFDEESPTEFTALRMGSPTDIKITSQYKKEKYMKQICNVSPVERNSPSNQASSLFADVLKKDLHDFSMTNSRNIAVAFKKDLHNNSITSSHNMHSRSYRLVTEVSSPYRPVYDDTVLLETAYDPGFIDSHCHLDFLFQRTNHLGTLGSFKEKCKDEEVFPVSFEGCVAVFCDPSSFKKTVWWGEITSESDVWAAFGCHPHYVSRYAENEVWLEMALTDVNVVALGEIGLDYSTRNNESIELQKEVFRKQLEMALEYKKPIVIHCRDAHSDCINILREMVPRNHRIHRHCFTDTWAEAEEWLDSFPNLYLGFTGLITQDNHRARMVRRVIERVSLDKILLETDAPYFRPKIPGLSHPGMAIHVAAQIASIKRIDIRMVLHHTRENTKMMYGI